MDHSNYIRQQIAHIATVIDAPLAFLPTLSNAGSTGRAHIELQGEEFHYVTGEGGAEVERLTTGRIDDLLYFVFRDVTGAMANAQAAEGRIADQGPLRLVLQRQIELLDRLNPEWAIRRGLEEREDQDQPVAEDAVAAAADAGPNR